MQSLLLEAGTGSCPTRSAASIMPIFPHPLSASRLADLPSTRRRRANGEDRGGISTRAASNRDTLPYQLITPLLHCILRERKREREEEKKRGIPLSERRQPITFSFSEILLRFLELFLPGPFNCQGRSGTPGQMLGSPLAREDATTAT